MTYGDVSSNTTSFHVCSCYEGNFTLSLGVRSMDGLACMMLNLCRFYVTLVTKYEEQLHFSLTLAASHLTIFFSMFSRGWKFEMRPNRNFF